MKLSTGVWRCDLFKCQKKGRAFECLVAMAFVAARSLSFTVLLSASPPPRPNRIFLKMSRRHCLPVSRSSAPEPAPEAEISRATLLWRAAKLPIYSVAFVPLTVGSSAAYLETGIFFARRYLLLLISSVLIITWLNLSNDVYDFDTGADLDKKESVVNIIGSRELVYLAAIVSLALGFMGLFCAYIAAGDIRFILLVMFAIFCGYVYQCPPFRLSYQGLGEPLCFAAFGPFATTAFYLSQSGKTLAGEPCLPVSRTVLSASFLVGLTTTLILFCSHFHQIDSDRAVGKMSPLVRIGTKTSSEVVKFGILTLYLLVFAFGLCKSLPLSCTLLCTLTLPMGNAVVDYVEKNYNDNLKIFMAKYYCVRLHALFGAALAVGLFFAGKR
ncbi:putative 1,4-dihydroxy-2-naphthoate polyprenyltransferase [Dioscorea sansibarensis]